MSFDTEFDYTKGKNYLDDLIIKYTDKIAEIDAELAVLQGISGYEGFTNNTITVKLKQKNIYETQLADAQDARGEIDNVEGLNASDKSVLLAIYNDRSENKRYWMARMMYNAAGIVSDAAPMMVDGALSDAEKSILCNLIAQKYSIRKAASDAAHAFPRN